MNEVRKAIKDKLKEDTELLALLPNGANSIVAQGDVDADTSFPCLILEYDGSNGNRYISEQRWSVLCYIDPQTHNFTTSSAILAKVRGKLDGDTITISTSSGVACAECEWFMDLPTDYDPYFRANVEGQRFRVHVVNI